MKRIAALVLFCLAIAACTKDQNATNNYKITTPPNQPAFEVNGIKDIGFTNWFGVSVTMNISVIYLDSAQQNVALTLSALPAGITMDTAWNNNGFPNFNTTLTLYDTTFQG